jgi:hypothetical protein
VVLVFVLVSIDTPLVLFLIFLGYGLSGPTRATASLYRRLTARRSPGGHGL